MKPPSANPHAHFGRHADKETGVLGDPRLRLGHERLSLVRFDHKQHDADDLDAGHDQQRQESQKREAQLLATFEGAAVGADELVGTRGYRADQHAGGDPGIRIDVKAHEYRGDKSGNAEIDRAE